MSIALPPTLLRCFGDALVAPAHAAFVPPGAADLGESPEIALSPAIRAKAAELNNNPVAIYNWVRNNVEWVPTYGSVQDADATLAAQRGNAFAVSSLLIALLRAAGVSARYAYGVIEVPMAQAQNWVGGTTHPNAALSVLYQGGIPNAGVVEGGRLTAVRMEHIWVEAFVDFVPSRGAKHGQPDAWVALDASFKQYNHAAGYDLATNVPFDAEGLINDLQASATSNESEGWVQNVDQALIQQRFEQYRAQVENYITNANPDATVGEVLGTRQTIVFAPMQLASGLPYTLQAVTARYSEIPQPLRHTYRVTLAEKTPLATSTGATVIDVSIPLSVVTRKALALSFVPATQADEDVLLSYLPQDGSSNLPAELPGYLIDMKAQLTLDGEVVGEGGVFPMGTELNLTHYFTDPRRTVKPVSSNVIAGEYHAIGVDGGQINLNLLTKTKTQLEQAKSELEAIKAQLDNNQTPAISDFLTKHTLTGNLLQTGILGYFAINDSLDQLDARSMGVVTQRLPSFGTFATSLEPQYLFGSIPRNVKLAGLSMDVDRISTLAMAKDGSNQKNIVFFRATGPRKSAFEHLVPEQLFSTAEAPAQAVSAVKALAIAAQQGQKIYTLTKANAAQLNTLTISQTAKIDIAAALNAGKEVTVHQGPIINAGWTGEGYVVLDPNTGAGAYKISGGLNGSNSNGSEIDDAFYGYGMIDKIGKHSSDLEAVVGLIEILTERVFPLLKSVLKILDAKYWIQRIVSECKDPASRFGNIVLYVELVILGVFVTEYAALGGLSVGGPLGAAVAGIAASVAYSKGAEEVLNYALRVCP
ncbi:MAG: transglutaminase-like domain-containing protein [Pseudomonadota bacterium]